MNKLLTAIRYITGLLFIFSGLIKANDPLGLSYKMQEFFEIWHLPGLMPFTLALSVFMITFEILAGVAVLIGWKMNLFSWLLLALILFFTFLTGYAVFSGKVRECGCFGDCIPLQANQSFIKDLVLLAFIVVLFLNRHRIQVKTPSQTALALIAISTILTISLQWYVLNHLPLLDCLPYKKGSNVLQNLQPPPGSIPDSTTISFVYQKNGKEVEFGADQFPEDFNDSTYTYVRRYDKLVRKGNAEPAIKDFMLQSLSGTDTTKAVLSQPGRQLFFMLKDGYEIGEWRAMSDLIRTYAAAHKIPVFLVTNLSPDAINFPGFTILRCDATAIKTAARTNPALIELNDGVIRKKWANKDFGLAFKKISEP